MLGPPTRTFTTAPSANIIGICLYSTGGGSGIFKNIDANGNFITGFNYTTHPTYNLLSQVSIDSSIMTQVSTIYIKTATSGPTGSDSYGKKCWWISDVAYPGFVPAPAFKRDGVVKNTIWWGTYLGNVETVRTKSCLGSKYNKTVAASRTKSSFKTLISNRNSGSITGFRMFDIWDFSLLKLLLLIYGGGSNSQTIWGDNTSHTTYPKTGKTGSNGLYMCDLWATYLSIIDGINLNTNGYITLTNPFDQSTITTDINANCSGWIVDVCSGAFDINGETHDLLELFIPDSTSTNSTDTTFPDYCTIYGNSTYNWVSGGRWDDWENAGLFCFDNSYWDLVGYTNIGCRIAKS